MGRSSHPPAAAPPPEAPAGSPPPSHDLSFERLVRESSRYVWRELTRRRVPARDRPDVAQNVFLAVHASLPRYDPSIGPWRPWLWGIVRNQNGHYHAPLVRKGERLAAAPGTGTADEGADPEEALRRAQMHALVHEVLDGLAPEHRAILVAKDIEGRRMADIAAEMAIPESTAYKHHERARQAFRRAFERRTEKDRHGAPLLLLLLFRRFVLARRAVEDGTNPAGIEPSGRRRAIFAIALCALVLPVIGSLQCALEKQPREAPTTSLALPAPDAITAMVLPAPDAVTALALPTSHAVSGTGTSARVPPEESLNAHSAPDGTSTSPGRSVSPRRRGHPSAGAFLVGWSRGSAPPRWSDLLVSQQPMPAPLAGGNAGLPPSPALPTRGTTRDSSARDVTGSAVRPRERPWLVSGGPLGAVGLSGAPSMGGFVSVGARSSDASLSLEARAFAPAPSQIEAQTAFDVSLVSAAVLPCTHPSMFYACAEIEIGRMQVRSRLEPDSKGYLRVAAGARAGVELPLVEDVSLRGHADVLFPVAAAKITVSGRTAFEPSPLTALLGADVLWSF